MRSSFVAGVVVTAIFSWLLVPVRTSSQCSSSITHPASSSSSLQQQQFLYLANNTCLSCPVSCSSCLSTVDDISYPCSSCQDALGFVPNPRSPLSAGGTCSACSTLGLMTSYGSRRLRLKPASSGASTGGASSPSTADGIPLEGRLEVFYSGQWWSVCDDGWTLTNTDVVCRELNLGRGAAFTRQYDATAVSTSSSSGSSSSSSSQLNSVPKIGFDDVTCDISDSSFFSCREISFAVRRADCESYETIGVRCSGPAVNNTCTVDCPIGQFMAAGGQCIDCPTSLSGCLSCEAVVAVGGGGSGSSSNSSVARCVACESPNWLLIVDVLSSSTVSSCVSKCPAGQFGNSSTGTCQKCQTPCLTCVSSAVQQQESVRCTSCVTAAMALFDGHCVDRCPSGTFLLNITGNAAVCVSHCPDYFYGDLGGQCRRCSAECLTCFGRPTNCTICAVSSYVMMTTRIDDVSSLTSSCLPNCPSEYYAAADQHCRRCIDDRCSTCYPGGLYCSSCSNQSDVIEMGRCVERCSRGLHVSGGLLQPSQCLPTCDEGFYTDLTISAQCLPCSALCIRCLSATLCVACQSGYFVDTVTGQCVERCPSQTVALGLQYSGTPSIVVRNVGGLTPLDGIVEVFLEGLSEL